MMEAIVFSSMAGGLADIGSSGRKGFSIEEALVCLLVHVCVGCVFLSVCFGNEPLAITSYLLFLSVLHLGSYFKYMYLGEPLYFSDMTFLPWIFFRPRLYIGVVAGRVLMISGLLLCALIAAGIAVRISSAGFSTTTAFGEASWPLLLVALAAIGGIAFRPSVSHRLIRSDATRLHSCGLLPDIVISCIRMLSVGPGARVDVEKLIECRGVLPIEDLRGLETIVVIQCESFVAPDRIEGAPRLPNYGRLRSGSALHGKLAVPAFGANTVRSEFSFITGVANELLGVHRHQPYLNAGWFKNVSIVQDLRRAGWKTVFVHPFHRSFYRRHRALPELGFDTFVDEAAFSPRTNASSPRARRNVSDRELARAVIAELEACDGPAFLMAVTMENHGPWHADRAKRLSKADAYLSGLKGADGFLSDVSAFLETAGKPAILCFYADHAPALSLPGLSDVHNVDFFIKPFGFDRIKPSARDLRVEMLLRETLCVAAACVRRRTEGMTPHLQTNEG